ncbi:hypothetical protein SDC9_199691 [bioreactor metagenome]|uniref:Uncharacterized protein n=1 Tax=bioreactor metagenome TaxID=1076179 RepID=A0A645INR7_9ZZZZ
MMGINTIFGTSINLAMKPRVKPWKINIAILATNTASMIVLNRTGCKRLKFGPIGIPWMMNAPMITAVAVSPGTARESIGINAPPVVALLALSEAARPDGFPFPNVSGFFESFLAVAYASIAAGPPPRPGRIPTKTPIMLEMDIVRR